MLYLDITWEITLVGLGSLLAGIGQLPGRVRGAETGGDGAAETEAGGTGVQGGG